MFHCRYRRPPLHHLIAQLVMAWRHLCHFTGKRTICRFGRNERNKAAVFIPCPFCTCRRIVHYYFLLLSSPFMCVCVHTPLINQSISFIVRTRIFHFLHRHAQSSAQDWPRGRRLQNQFQFRPNYLLRRRQMWATSATVGFHHAAVLIAVPRLRNPEACR